MILPLADTDPQSLGSLQPNPAGKFPNIVAQQKSFFVS